MSLIKNSAKSTLKHPVSSLYTQGSVDFSKVFHSKARRPTNWGSNNATSSPKLGQHQESTSPPDSTCSAASEADEEELRSFAEHVVLSGEMLNTSLRRQQDQQRSFMRALSSSSAAAGRAAAASDGVQQRQGTATTAENVLIEDQATPQPRDDQMGELGTKEGGLKRKEDAIGVPIVRRTPSIGSSSVGGEHIIKSLLQRFVVFEILEIRSLTEFLRTAI
jgi:hypothetical protein